MIGLYYPFIHFRDENWLKLALIYWSKIARIVPESFKTHDSGEVCRVQDELDAVINCSPEEAFQAVDHFRIFIQRNAARLRKKYAIRHSGRWKIDKYTRSHAPPGTDPRFAYIYKEKLADSLVHMLLEEGLAVQGEGIGPTLDWRWIGVHPAIAAVYMTSIAEALASQSGYRLLADNLANHLVVGEKSVDRLAELLLRDGSQPTKQRNLIEFEPVALIALRTILPQDISNIPMKKIIQLRKRFPAELADFQAWVNTTTKALTDTTGGVISPSAMKEHLKVLEQQQIKPRLATLKGMLNSLAIETVTGAMSVKSPWNITGATAALYFSQPLLAVGGVALSAIPNIGKQRREAQRAISGNHAAYLLHAQEYLTPRTLTNRIGRTWRKLSIEV